MSKAYLGLGTNIGDIAKSINRMIIIKIIIDIIFFNIFTFL